MSDTDNDNQTDGETPAPDTADHTDTDDDNDDGGEAWDKARGMSTINKLRDEVKALKADKRKAADLEKRLREIEDANKTEEQKRLDRLTELEAADAARTQELRALKLKVAVHERANTLGIADAALAVAALNTAAVEYDDNGHATNLDEVLVDILERHPALRASTAKDEKPRQGTDAGTGNTPGPAPSLTAEELAAANLTGMDPAAYARFKNVKTLEDYQAARAASS